MKGALPPSYVNTPVAIAYVEADDALIVTMTRILGLCWAHDYERTPALTPEQLTEAGIESPYPSQSLNVQVDDRTLAEVWQAWQGEGEAGA